MEGITSYHEAAAGDVVNEVAFAYNAFAQLTVEYQEHGGAVNTSTSPKVGYSYADGSQGTIRPTQLVYPNGRILNYGYNAGSDDVANRVSYLADNSPLPPGEGQGEGLNQQLVTYQYLGLSSILDISYPQPGIRGTYDVDPSAPGTYPGLDQFGRVVDLLWKNNSSGAALERIQHGYDHAGNRLWRQCPVATAAGKNFDELYSYDGVSQLRSFQRGSLSTGQTSLASGTENFAQQWTLDATGNWVQFQEDDAGGGTWNLDQTRTHDTANEITQFAETAGPPWAQPAYDRNGSMISMPQPASPTSAFTCTYDAWNRLVKVVDPTTPGTTISYRYDGRNYQIVRTSVSGSTNDTGHFYYSDQWQLLQQSAVVGGPAQRQFVWGSRYIDDLVLRDRDTTGDGTLDERLYALQDANWNVTALSDPTGDVVERYQYSAYGQPAFLTGAFAGLVASFYELETLYCGYRWDETVGAYSVRRRVLWSQLGRWDRRDPIAFAGGDANVYRYCGNGPTVRTDFRALDWLDSYSNWFNGTFGSGWSDAVGGAIYQTTVGSGLISNDTLANASANELAAVTGVAAVGIVAGGEAVAAAAYANAFAITDAVGTAILAPGTMAYEGAAAVATAAEIAYPGFSEAFQNFFDPTLSASLVSGAGTFFSNYALPSLINGLDYLSQHEFGPTDYGCSAQPPGWDGYFFPFGGV